MRLGQRGPLDDVEAERCLHQAAHLAGREHPRRAVERRHEPPPRTRRQVAAVGLAPWILGELGGERVEARALPDPCQRGLGLPLGRGLLGGVGLRPRGEQNVLQHADVGSLVEAVHRRLAHRAPARHQAVVPVGALELGDLGPHRLGDADRVHRQLALGHRLPEQRVVDPHVGDEVGGLAVDLDPLPARVQDLREPRRRELLAGGLRCHVGVGREEVAEVAAADEAERQARREDHVTSHDISRKGYFTAALSARTSAGTIGSPPSRSSRSESGMVRRTSAASCTSSSAEVSPASRGFVPAR